MFRALIRELESNYKIAGALLSSAILGGTIIVLACIVGGRSAVALNLTIIASGASAGWILGIILSPYDTPETKDFKQWAKAFGAFASGYVLSKFDKVLEEALEPATLFQEVPGFRVLAFCTALILSLIVTFAFRRYA